MSATISTHHISATQSAEALVLRTAPWIVTVDRGWHTDPRREHEMRFHDGETWTEHVTHFGPVPCRSCNPGRN